MPAGRRRYFSGRTLADVLAPVFQGLFNERHELVGDGSVDEAMIVAESQVHDGADGDGIVAVFVGDYHGLLAYAADSHDRGVGLVDDGQSEDGSKLARVRDCESRAFHVLRHELFGAGALAEIGDAALQSEEVQFIGVLEDGNDQPPVKSYGDAGVHVAVVANVVAFEGRIHDWELLEGNDRGTHEKWHEGEARAVALFETVLQLVAQVDDARQVHFKHGVDVGTGAAGFDHALGNDLAHLAHRDHFARNCRGSRSRARRLRRSGN